MNNKRYTPKYDYDLITKIYMEEYLSNIYDVGSIFIGANPSDKLKGKWTKIENVSVGNKNVIAWIRVE